MKQYLIVKGDTNDADYSTEIREISDETLEFLRPLIEKISECEDYHNWKDHNSDHFDKYPGMEDELDEFSMFCPCGIHSIDSIKVWTVTNEITLL